jgi:hypothetical protein
VDVFPKTFLPRKVGQVYKDQPLALDANTRGALKKYEAIDSLYDVDGRLAHLQVGTLSWANRRPTSTFR